MKFKVCFIFSLGLIALFLFSCKKKEKDMPEETVVTPPSPLASVVTSPIANITDSTAVSGGTVTSEGTSAITAVGICWDTLPGPTTLKNKTNNGAGVGNYISNLTGLKVNKTYYVRAYATNASGTAYGNEISFLTPVVTPWTKSNSASSYTITCLLNSGTTSIYAGTETGIIFSSDTGNTWMPKGLAGQYIKNITQKGTTLFAVTLFGDIYRSQDNGNTWVSILGNFPYPMSIHDVSMHNSKLIAGTDSSAFYSTDDGNSWTQTKNGLPPPVPMWWSGGGVYRTASSGPQVYVIAGTFQGPGTQPTLYKYNEGSNNWSYLGIFSQQSSLDLEVSGNNVLLSYNVTGFSEVSISTDGGNNWTTINNLPWMSIDVNNASVFLSNSIGDFSVSTNNGSTWSAIPKLGLPASSYGAGFISPHYLWINTTNGVYRYKYN